ncbi:hypothetical protein [Streptomyces netropsis]|uniref:Uncharacterized protein n=1 Tax=Streptomyces netropsis TaxID=55404 RepID=A0A7W7LF22_STRNE|nr:hypothetical protein [Streptomyces netropsis]MBB4888476.1 hypothetical protein [Streptomyces netropsis]GGR29007.1 hypothetical protein GCM10010219_37180 [Streptomyces netropsis]
MANADLMTVTLEGAPDSDLVELDELTVQLREELLELDVDRVEPVRIEETPVGSKPGDAIALGVLAVTLSPIALRGVFRLLETWMTNRPVRKVRVVFGDDSIELEQASAEDQRRLVDAFIGTHEPVSPVEREGETGTSGA